MKKINENQLKEIYDSAMQKAKHAITIHGGVGEEADHIYGTVNVVSATTMEILEEVLKHLDLFENE